MEGLTEGVKIKDLTHLCFDTLAPPADCTKDEDCNAKAGCIKGNCVCKGKTVGDGKQACRGKFSESLY